MHIFEFVQKVIFKADHITKPSDFKVPIENVSEQTEAISDFSELSKNVDKFGTNKNGKFLLH